MVDAISNSAGRTRTQRSNLEPSGVSGTSGMAPQARASETAAPRGAVDSLSISVAARALPDELKAGPPVDLESVTRIREAIAENRYPIDLEAITESLFQSFLEVSR